MIHDPTTDENTIIEAVRNSTAAAEQFALERHRLSVALFDLLDEEQRAQAMQLLEQLPEQRFRGRRGQRRGGTWGENQPDY